ncbi:MAG: alpha/beta hydrolase [Telmatospirillum sp.]|nr:alpha/beta hydrolase [Telmatospirillum sp.]
MRHRVFKSLGSSGFHQVAYTEWGDPANPRVLVCVHGLCRNGRDFDFLAEALAGGWRVVCPDMPGRGDSDWLDDKAAYSLSTYLSDCAALIARLDVDEIVWLGTSMGGIIGMNLAAMPGNPVKGLIVNDVGPVVPAAGLRRIVGLLSGDPRFADAEEAEEYFHKAMARFGVKRPEEWRHVVETGTRPDGEGHLRLHYDPGILSAYYESEPVGDISFWRIWDSITCPTLILRGEQSDVLLAETARQMLTRGPTSDLAEVAGCGHAPALFEKDQISLIAAWLDRL